MLKSFTLIPSNDILSYKDHKEYPYILFPSLIFIYNRKRYIKLDERELAILYNINCEKFSGNRFVFKSYPFENPLNILVEENYNHEKLKNNKIKKILKILPFTRDINILITNLIDKEITNWRLTKQRTCKSNGVNINTYTTTNEKVVSFNFLLSHSYHSKLRKRLFLECVIYGIFNPNMYKPLKIHVKYVHKNINGHIPIEKNKITKILFLTKFYINKNNNENEDEYYNTEDILMEEISYFTSFDISEIRS